MGPPQKEKKMKRPNSRKYTRELRREEAEKRQEVRDNRSPQQQLDVLNSRLGEDIGALKERVRLLREIADLPRQKGKK
jgi:hypothetical protein